VRQLRRNAPIVLLGLALAASSALLLALGAQLTFFQDTWAFLLERRGTSASDFLRPHNEHISVIPVAIEKLLIGAFGMTTALPERILLTLMLAATATLVFVYVRRRIGAWPALFAAVSLLFLGPAWEVLLWPFEISLVGSLLTGVAMLLALDREDRRGDLAACTLLVASIGFSSLGVAFLAGAAVDILVRRRARGLRRAYVAVVPLVLYGAWYLGYGHETESALSLTNAVHAPLFVVESVAAAAGALLGARVLLDGLDDRQLRYAGVIGLAALAGLLTYLQLRQADFVYLRRRTAGISARAWPAIASAGAFWLLAALNRIPGREPTTSRYLHIGAAFVLLVLADLLRGARFRSQALALGGAGLLIVVCLNLVPLVEGQERLERESALARGDLAALEIARRTVDPEFRLDPETAGTPSLINVSAAPYLAEAAESGSPAYTPAELAAAPSLARRQADVVLARALPLTTRAADVEPTGRYRRCVRVGEAELPLRPGVTAVATPPDAGATLLLRRFATDGYPVRFEAAPGAPTLLRIPPDRARRPWRLRLQGPVAARVCSHRG